MLSNLLTHSAAQHLEEDSSGWGKTWGPPPVVGNLVGSTFCFPSWPLEKIRGMNG